MTNLEMIKNQLAELTVKVNGIGSTNNEYIFTQEEMIDFVTSLHDEFTTGIRANIEMNLELEPDWVELSLDGTEITIDFDESYAKNMIVSQILDTEIDEEDILTTINQTYKKYKHI